MLLLFQLVGPEFMHSSSLDDDCKNIKLIIAFLSIVIGIITSVMTCLTWLLYTDFGWEVFKRIGADIKLKKMYQLYQVYVCLLKFDGFFLLGFEIQFLVLVSGTPTAEFVLTIAALPITLVCLVSAAFVVRMESRRGVYAFFVLQFFGLAYFFYKVSQDSILSSRLP